MHNESVCYELATRVCEMMSSHAQEAIRTPKRVCTQSQEAPRIRQAQERLGRGQGAYVPLCASLDPWLCTLLPANVLAFFPGLTRLGFTEAPSASHNAPCRRELQRLCARRAISCESERPQAATVVEPSRIGFFGWLVAVLYSSVPRWPGKLRASVLGWTAAPLDGNGSVCFSMRGLCRCSFVVSVDPW